MVRSTGMFVLVVVSLLYFGCDSSGNPAKDTSVPDQTNGRITIVNDEAALNARVKVMSDTVQVVGGGLAKTASPNALQLVLEAEIEPPTVNGQKLQATSVSLDDKFAYISYSLRGESYAGAVDIVQIKGLKNATIRSEATFNDTKVNAAYFDATSAKVYLAEANGSGAYDSPSLVEQVSTSGNKLNLSNTTKKVLNSYVATSVFAKNNKVYVTTGNTGGLFILSQDSLTQSSYTAISDARWVDADATNIAVVQGGGKLTVLNNTTGAVVSTFSFTGTSIPESKSTVQIIGRKALIAAGDGGVVLMSLTSGKILGTIPRTTVAGLDPSLTVTNAVAASGEYLYLSNGEAGVYQAKTVGGQDLSSVTGDTEIGMTIQGKLSFSSKQSVNHVAFDGEMLVIASGLGGVKIVSVKQ